MDRPETVSVRRIWLSFSDSYPYAHLLRHVVDNLRMLSCIPPLPSPGRACQPRWPLVSHGHQGKPASDMRHFRLGRDQNGANEQEK